MGNSALTIDYSTFERFAEFKDINCKVKKIETPLKMTKLLNKSKSIIKLFEKEEDISKKKNLRDLNIITLTNLFRLASKDKVFLQNIIKYLKKVKIKCKEEYNKYTQKLVRQNLFCDYKKLKKIKSLHKDYLLNKIIVKFTDYIIENIKIDKEIIEIEHIKYNLFNKYYSIIKYDTDILNIFFKFTMINKNNLNYLNYKYEKIIEQLKKLRRKIGKNNILKKYDKITYKELINLNKLHEKHDNLYCKLLKDIITDKEYIKSYIEYQRQ
jgi:hypothetical protein